jgi:L-serine dehydratase
MISTFDLFRIGIGPSSSHTMGPMRAAARFVAALAAAGRLDRAARLTVRLYGSLAWTGRGHATDRAVVLGLAGLDPETIDPVAAAATAARVAAERTLHPGGRPRPLRFDANADIVFDFDTVPPGHTNALRLQAVDDAGEVLADELWFSIGGGFVHRDGEAAAEAAAADIPYAFADGDELLRVCESSGLTIADLMLANETAMRPAGEVGMRLDRIAATMDDAIERGLGAGDRLPGDLRLGRRAPDLARRLDDDIRAGRQPALEAIERVSLWAIAVAEENAAGGLVVTAPTNGAAGVVPAVLRHATGRCPGTPAQTARVFLLAAAAIGALFKRNASISGAEVGCQGEIGVAAAMAAAGLAAVLGGTNAQVENAAEIAMEHHLGLTCDPVGGLVQIPCIERNAFGAVKALNAATLALRGDGQHRVSLDQVIATMRQTGADMQAKYKETSRGGLAVAVPSC